MPFASYLNSRFLAVLYLFERSVANLAIIYGTAYSRGFQDRENESRFGATPVPGKIGMAMAGQGLTVGPPPRPAYHNSFGQNPGNQLYVGNVSISVILSPSQAYCFRSCLTRLAGRT